MHDPVTILVKIEPLLADRSGGQDEGTERGIEGDSHIGGSGPFLQLPALFIAKAQGISTADASLGQCVATKGLLDDFIESQRGRTQRKGLGQSLSERACTLTRLVPHHPQAFIENMQVFVQNGLQIAILRIPQTIRPIGSSWIDLGDERNG